MHANFALVKQRLRLHDIYHQNKFTITTKTNSKHNQSKFISPMTRENLPAKTTGSSAAGEQVIGKAECFRLAYVYQV